MRKPVAVGLSVLLSAAIWTNSYLIDRQVSYDSDTVVMQVGDQEVNVSEVMIHFLLKRDYIESQWGTSMWEARTGTDTDGTIITYEDNVKSDIEQELETEKALKQEAEEKDITLTQDEKSDCKEKAEETIREFSDEEILQYGITINKLTEHYEDQLLAYKFCGDSLEGIEGEYDQDDYETTTVKVMLFSVSEDDEEEMTEEEKAERKKEAEAALEELKDGESFENVVEEYEVDYEGEQSFLIAEEDGKNEKYNQIKDLEDGEFGEIIETARGYWIVQLISKVDEEKSLKAWENAVETAIEDVIVQIYSDQYEDDYQIKLYEEIWEDLPLASGDE